MSSSLRIAAAQFPVTDNIVRNADYVKKLTLQAVSKGANVIQFPEAALSGYGPKHFPTLENYPWDRLRDHLQIVCEMAASKGIWIILGAMRRSNEESPRLCLHVISDTGEIVGTYDKQRLYKREKEMFAAGSESLAIGIRGFLCGFLICYDNCFPELYEAYRKMGVGLLFHSFYNAGNSGKTAIQDLMLASLMVRAADNQICISASNSSEPYSPLCACIVRPDGSVIRSRRNVTGMAIDDYPAAKLGWAYDNRSI